MQYKLVINIRYIGDVIDGRFVTHLKSMEHLWSYLDKWKDKPVTMGDHEEPMDWDDPIKVWYKLMGDMRRDTMVRAIAKGPPPAGLPDDAPFVQNVPNV